MKKQYPWKYGPKKGEKELFQVLIPVFKFEVYEVYAEGIKDAMITAVQKKEAGGIPDAIKENTSRTRSIRTRKVLVPVKDAN